MYPMPLRLVYGRLCMCRKPPVKQDAHTTASSFVVSMLKNEFVTLSLGNGIYLLLMLGPLTTIRTTSIEKVGQQPCRVCSRILQLRFRTNLC